MQICLSLGRETENLFGVAILAPVTNVNGYFTGTSSSFAGLSNKPVVSRRARVGTRPIFPEHSTLGHASSRFSLAFNFRARV